MAVCRGTPGKEWLETSFLPKSNLLVGPVNSIRWIVSKSLNFAYESTASKTGLIFPFTKGGGSLANDLESMDSNLRAWIYGFESMNLNLRIGIYELESIWRIVLRRAFSISRPNSPRLTSSIPPKCSNAPAAFPRRPLYRSLIYSSLVDRKCRLVIQLNRIIHVTNFDSLLQFVTSTHNFDS